MSKSDSATLPFTLTSKHPLRGFSSLTTTLAAGKPAFTRASSFVALVLKAPQDLHASILTMALPEVDAPPAFLGAVAFGATAFFWMVFFGAIPEYCESWWPNDFGGSPARHGTRENRSTTLSGVRGARARAGRSCRVGGAVGARSARRSPSGLSVARLRSRLSSACNCAAAVCLSRVRSQRACFPRRCHSVPRALRQKVKLRAGSMARRSRSAAGPASGEGVDWTSLTANLPVGRDTASGLRRTELFNRFDVNKNGSLNLAEVVRAIRDVVGLDNSIPLKSMLRRATRIAREANSSKRSTKPRNDDFVERDEFRVLLMYVRQYFEMYVACDRLDPGATAGPSDRRVDLAEFRSSLETLAKWGIHVPADAAEEEFRAIDTKRAGAVLFDDVRGRVLPSTPCSIGPWAAITTARVRIANCSSATGPSDGTLTSRVVTRTRQASSMCRAHAPPPSRARRRMAPCPS